MRYKELQFLGKIDNTIQKNYGFKTRKCPLYVEEPIDFENDMMYGKEHRIQEC